MAIFYIDLEPIFTKRVDKSKTLSLDVPETEQKEREPLRRVCALVEAGIYA